MNGIGGWKLAIGDWRLGLDSETTIATRP